MKHLTFSLLTACLCLITLFSCQDNSSSASLDEGKGTKILSTKNNTAEKKSNVEVSKEMNKPNTSKSQAMMEAEKLVASKKNIKPRRLGDGQAKQSTLEMRRRYEEVKSLPPTADQKNIANGICDCLKGIGIFKSINKATTPEEIERSIGLNKLQEAKSLQNCYNNIMVPKVNDMGKDASIFAMKSRSYLNKQCLNGTDQFWVALGAYINKVGNSPDGIIKVPNAQ